MSNTPETDAAWACFKGYMEPLQDVKDLSRKLERERDEAREALKHIEEYGTEEINAAIDLRQKLASSLVERDEARKLLGTPLSVAISERNDALHALTGWENKWKVAVEMAAKAELERDEAREHLRAANKGAETNAKINQSLAKQITWANAMADKAKELVARWDQPSWKDTTPTAGFIHALRDAVEDYEERKP